MKNHLQRRQREKQEVRLRIVDAARELFTGGGAEAVTLRAVARRIEYSAATIYLHFADKEALIREVCAVDFAEFSRVLKQAERIADPVDRLRRVALACVDFGLRYPGHYREMFMTRTNPPPPAAAAEALPPGEPPAAAGSAGPYDFLHTAVFKAVAAGCFRPAYRDVAQIAQVLWSGLHGVVALHLVRAGFPGVPWRPVEANAGMMVDCLLRGLLPDGAQWDASS